MDIYTKVVNDSKLYKGENLRIINKFKDLLPKEFFNLKKKQIGMSSNNTNPKSGVKIIANSFELMNEKNDKLFIDAVKIYPFFKLTYKNVPKGNINDVFKKNSKLIYLLYNNK
jgi:hypothetical protein